MNLRAIPPSEGRGLDRHHLRHAVRSQLAGVFVARSLLGLVVGTLFLSASLTPSLTPRPPLLMGVLAGACLALGYLLGISARGVWSGMGLPVRPAQPAVARLVALLCVGIALVCSWLSIGWQNDLRALFGMELLSRSNILVVLVIALITFALFFFAGVVARGSYRRTVRWLGARIPGRVATLLGVLFVGAAAWGLMTGVVLRAGLRIADSSFSEVDALMEPDVPSPTSTFQTGGPTSLIAWESLGRRGRQYVATGPSRAEIAATTGSQAEQPLRVYAGLNSAASVQERARLALAELKRVGGFERSVLVIIAPTGTGWVDSNAIDSLELLHRGDVASVALQYSYLASWLSLTVEPEYGVESARALFREVYAHWVSLPKKSRPRLYLFGLSLGALSSERSLDLFDIIEDPIQGALWAGPPFPSLLWNSATANRERNSPVWLPRFRDSSIVRFTNQQNQLAADGDRWGPVRIVYLQYGSDPITFFRPDSLYRRPEWLTGRRAPDVLPSLRWIPVVTFMQTGVDLITGMRTPPGKGHVFAAEHYLKSWVALTDPPGWSEAELEELRRMISQKRPH